MAEGLSGLKVPHKAVLGKGRVCNVRVRRQGEGERQPREGGGSIFDPDKQGQGSAAAAAFPTQRGRRALRVRNGGRNRGRLCKKRVKRQRTVQNGYKSACGVAVQYLLRQRYRGYVGPGNRYGERKTVFDRKELYQRCELFICQRLLPG